MFYIVFKQINKNAVYFAAVYNQPSKPQIVNNKGKTVIMDRTCNLSHR